MFVSLRLNGNFHFNYSHVPLNGYLLLNGIGITEIDISNECPIWFEASTNWKFNVISTMWFTFGFNELDIFSYFLNGFLQNIIQTIYALAKLNDNTIFIIDIKYHFLSLSFNRYFTQLLNETKNRFQIPVSCYDFLDKHMEEFESE